MRSLIVFLVLLGSAEATTLFPHRDFRDYDGTLIAWQGSSTAFTGYYEWPPDRKPLTRFNGPSGQLVSEPDFMIASCDAASSRCTVALNEAYGRRLENGGLPDGTEVKFTTTGTLPGGLIAWEQDAYKSYYIREWSGASFKLSESPGGPALELTSDSGSGTHGMTFAGYTHVMFLRMVKGVEFTCDPETDICTSVVPHKKASSPKSTAWVRFYSSGVMPGGFTTHVYGGQEVNHCMDVIDETHFRVRLTQLIEPDCVNGNFPLWDVTDQGNGKHYIYSNTNTGNASAEYGTVYFWSLTGYPQGTVLSFRDGADVARTIGWTYTSGRRPFADTTYLGGGIVAKIPAVTPAGEFRITIQTSEAQSTVLNPATYEFTLKTVSIGAFGKPGPASYPPIPGHKLGSSVLKTGQCGSGGGDCSWATWEYIMTSDIRGGGAAIGSGLSPTTSTAGYRRCSNRSDPVYPQGMSTTDPTQGYPIGFPGSEALVWYYNDESFFKIADYTQDATWANCGMYIAGGIRDRLLNVSHRVSGRAYFPWMLVAAYGWSGDPSYKEAIIRIGTDGNNAWGAIDEYRIREHAYAFERRLARRAVTGIEDYDLEQFADAALGMIYNNATGAPERLYQQPFMIGLAARPLIRWYAISRDERVPYVLKLWMDRAYAEWWRPEPVLRPTGTYSSGFLYNPEEYGPRCDEACAQPIGSALNNLVAPIWAWYWRLTGEEAYRIQGDEIFSRQFRDGYPYNAKEWSQTYYWSWDYVAWREGKKPAY